MVERARLIAIPELSLGALIAPSGSGKSSFVRKHFQPTEILSSNDYRELIADNDVGSPAQIGVWQHA